MLQLVVGHLLLSLGLLVLLAVVVGAQAVRRVLVRSSAPRRQGRRAVGLPRVTRSAA